MVEEAIDLLTGKKCGIDLLGHLVYCWGVFFLEPAGSLLKQLLAVMVGPIILIDSFKHIHLEIECSQRNTKLRADRTSVTALNAILLLITLSNLHNFFPSPLPCHLFNDSFSSPSFHCLAAIGLPCYLRASSLSWSIPLNFLLSLSFHWTVIHCK